MNRAKRLLCVLLTLCMVLGMFPVTALASSTPFADVSAAEWYYDDVSYVYANGIMNGTGNGKFSPDGVVTRGMMVTILHRLEGEPFVSGMAFHDVDVDAYYGNAVAWASGYGIVNGMGDGRFAPDASITREQLAAILYRYADYTGKDVSDRTDLNRFADADQVSDYAKTAMRWAVAEGLISGMGDNRLNPTGTATRAQVAAILSRFCNVDSTTGLLLPGSIFDRNNKKEEEDDGIYTVTFDSNGGSEVAPQEVAKGNCVTKPEDPEKEGYQCIGWYLGEGYSDLYNFNSPVEQNITLYAKWYNLTDTSDSDGDGLSDSLEAEFGCDPKKSDTDGDSLSDYLELNWLNYDPNSLDSDNNGIPDSEEDPDKDGLSNNEEAVLGTNAVSWDTDDDYLSDYDEVYLYQTDPLNPDTDLDGVNDGVEVELDSDPLINESQFETTATYGNVDEHTTVSVEATASTDAEGAGTLHIEEVSATDNPLLSQSISGYLGTAYNFTTDGNLKEAEITFNYDTSLGEIGENFMPAIYYFNEETAMLEELPNQTVENGKVTAVITHFSTYILLNKVEFDKVWETEIKMPQDDENHGFTGIDVVFVIDSSGSMQDNDGSGLRKTAAKAFIDKLGEDDRAAIIDFDNYANVYQSFTSDHDSLKAAIDRVNSSGGTSLSAGMSAAINLFVGNSYTRTDAYKYVIFMTDGDGSYSTSYTTTAQNNNIVVYTIGLGSGVKESKLRAIADGTSGKYYFASTADALQDIYVDVSFETVDYTTDSNNDGISDYYTKLLNDGILPISTGNFDLIEITDIRGEECDDWDGDGLKNGEEIEICVSGSKVYVKMTSHPLLVDSDFDGMSDVDEKKLGTPLMAYTSLDHWALDALMDDSRYVYIETAENSDLRADINAFFDWNKTDEAKEHMINFFYDYASKESIDNNQDKIAKLRAQEEYLKYFQAFSNIAKTANEICSVADDVSALAEGIPDDGDAKRFIDDARNKKIKLNGASAQLLKKRSVILEAMNTGKLTDDDILKTALSDADTLLTTCEEFDAFFHSYDTASFVEDISSAWLNATKVISAGVSSVKKIRDNYKFLKLDTGFKVISKGYEDFLKKKGAKTETYVSVALDVVGTVVDVWDNCNTYGKIKANRDAYVSYIDLMYYIKDNGEEKYVRSAADTLAGIIADEAWDAYDRQMWHQHGHTIVLSALSIAADYIPYVNVAKKVLDIVILTINVTGLGNNAKNYVACRTMRAISDGCINFINKTIDRQGKYFSYTPDDGIYLVQLAQCRLVGEDYCKQRLLKNDLAALLSRWFTKTGKDDIEDMFKSLSGSIYSNAYSLGLVLSSELPYYKEFSGGTNGAGGR